MDKVEERTIDVGKHRIFLREAGTGPLVLLLHGWLETSYSWRAQLPVLADAGYRAVAIDQLGYGRSSRPPNVHDYRITELVAVTAGVVEALEERTAIVVGHGWGSPVAWTCGWTRPDVFTALVGMGPPFGGRGLMGMPVSPFGELSPAEVAREMAGPDRIFYTEYFDLEGRAEREFDRDVRGFLLDLYYSASASVVEPGHAPIDPDALSLEERLEMARNSPVCLKPGQTMRDGLLTPDELPDWISEEEFDHYVGEFERTGIWGVLNWYRCMPINWELLARYEGRKVEVPALYIASDHDGPWIWARETIARMDEMVPDLRGQIVLENCGHWMQQEAPEAVNRALLGFLGEL